jgi:hypothetical protein
MNEHELLALAAIAANIDLNLQWGWNPFHDDGEAFLLAIKLDISVRQQFAMVTAEYPCYDEEFNERAILRESVLDDRPAAVRRVIVRAAAKMSETR